MRPQCASRTSPAGRPGLRPVPAVLAAFVAGDVLLQQLAQLPPCALLAGSAIAALLALLALGLLRMSGRPDAAAHPRALVAAALAALVLGFSLAGWRAQLRLAEALDSADEGRDIRVQAVVASLPVVGEGNVRFTARIEAVQCGRAVGWVAPGAVPAGDPDCFAVPRQVGLSWYGADPGLLPAQRWAWTVRLRRPQALLNPAGFDAEGWMLEQDIRALGTVRAGARDPPPRLLEPAVFQVDARIDRARAQLRAALHEHLADRRYGAVIVALVMGDQGGIAEADWSLFNRTGISHLVSISGLHITMIAGAVALVAGALWRRSAGLLRRVSLPVVRALAAIGGGLAYCLLAGWGVPAQRTLLMLSVVALALCARTRLGAGNILALAAAMVCLWDPWAVLAAGFWLSFGAVACIFLASSGRVAPPGSWRGALRETVRMQAAITVGQVPLTLAIFGQVSLVAPVANAVAIPLVSYLVAPLALVGAALLVLLPGLAAPADLALAAAEGLFGLLAQLLQLLTTPRWSSFALALPPAWTLASALLGSAWLLAPAGWPLRWIGLCALLPMLAWPPERPAPGELWLTALDVGQGMSLVLETAQAILVFDTGPRYGADADAGSRVIVPYLRARGVGTLDALVVSHQDIDHAGGAAALLHTLGSRQVWSSVDAGNPLLPAPAGRERCEAGRAFALGALRLDFLGPDAAVYTQPRASTNARSCVLLAQLGRHAVLLTGDVPARQERQLVERAAAAARSLRVDVLVAPHHGSHSSSSSALIAATAPRWVSIQAGYRNHFGHPHAEVLHRYREQGVAIARSDEDGAVQWRLGADGIRVVRWRRDCAHYWNNRPAAALAAGSPAVDGAGHQGDCR